MQDERNGAGMVRGGDRSLPDDLVQRQADIQQTNVIQSDIEGHKASDIHYAPPLLL